MKISGLTAVLAFTIVSGATELLAQKNPIPVNDSNTALHALQPDYKIPYGTTKPEDVKKVMDRVLSYLETSTPVAIVNSKTNVVITDYSKSVAEATLQSSEFRITGYEWGVTFGAMMLSGLVTGDKRYTDYTAIRMKFLSEAALYFKTYAQQYPDKKNPLRSVIDPRALDDAGSICAAMIKSERAGISNSLRPTVDNFMNYIMTREFRLADGTFARNRPLPNTLWLDDMYMSVPAIAQMGKLTGERKYYDEAVNQITLFSKRMFNKEKGLFMHGWVESMEVHPQFHWARANGWALMTMVEVLEVLPEEHPGRGMILELLQAHIRGLAAHQSGEGFWHQLIDRQDSYLETSATAIYAYCIAQAINRNWINRQTYGPMALLAWHAVSTKVNAKGQVEGTCVGTGMAFDPAFYYYRPVNVYAAHGYGPVLLAGAAMYQLLKEHPPEINDSAVMFPK